jgi:UDP-glucose 4-epimerase
MSIQTERVVVTGGAGFIGSHLVDRLLREGAKSVVVLDDLSRGRFVNLGEYLSDPRLHVVYGDVRDLQTVRDALTGATLVFHLAARASAIHTTTGTEEVFTSNVGGTFAVLRVASDLGIPRVVFASSCDAYGATLALPVDEDHPLLPLSLHGASKVSGEAYCRAFRRVLGVQTAVLRLCEVYGPNDSSGRVSEWIDRAIEGRELAPEDGQVSDLLWVDYAVEALLRAGLHDGTLPPINVASGTGTTALSLARRINQLSGSQVPVRTLAGNPSDARRFVANVDRMRRLLDLEPPIDPLAQLSDLVRERAPLGSCQVAS